MVPHALSILHVITTIDRGGAENQLFSLVCSQRKKGHFPAVAYLKGRPYWQSALSKQEITVSNLGLKVYGDLKPVANLRAAIRRLKPDIVHAHMPPAELYTRLALLIEPRPSRLVITKHNDEPFFRYPTQRIVGRWVARRASRIIAISEAVKAYSVANLDIPKTNIDTIHYGLESATDAKPSAGVRQCVRSSWGISQEQYVIGSVGRMARQKAQQTLLDAYALYCSTTCKDTRLVMVGKGKLENELRRHSRRLGIEHKVIWAGFRDDIPAVMSALDVFALTSSYEGFGLVLLEAMNEGLAVVASNVSAIPEIVLNNVTGILCEAGNPMQFADGFKRLEDSRLRERFGCSARKRVVEHFTMARTVEATLDVYRACLP